MKKLTPPTFGKFRLLLMAALASVVLAGCGGDKPEAMLASARDYLAKNEPKSAIIQLKNALQKNPEFAEARFLLGQALIQSGDIPGAEQELRKALAQKQPAERVVPLIATMMLLQGQYKKLTDEFGNVELQQAQAQAELKTSVAFAFLAQTKTDLSQSALSAALAADPTNVSALLMRAREKANQKDYGGALAIVDEVLSRSAANENALKLKGDILLYGNRDTEAALAAYKKSVDAAAGFVDGHTAILATLLRDARLDEAAKQLEVLKKVAPAAVPTVFYEALLAFKKGDTKLARERSQQMVKLAPNSHNVLQLAGAIEIEVNALLQAETYLTRAMQLAPDDILPRRLLTSVYLRSGQSAKALATAQPFLKLDVLDANSNSLLGQTFLQNGDPKRAAEYFAKSIKQDPKNEQTRTALALTRLGAGQSEAGLAELQDIAVTESGITATMALISAHLRNRDHDKALKAIDVLEKKQPDKPLAAYLRGQTLLDKRDLAGARRSFERSVEITPTYFASVAKLAAMDVHDKKPEDARKRFEAVLVKDPKNAQALLSLAELRILAGAPKDEVVQLIGRAVLANPLEKNARVMLVDFHLRNKDFKQAVSAAQDGIAVISDSPELQDALGRALQASGDTNQALAAFNRVVVMQPSSPIALMRLAAAYLAAKDKQASAQTLQKALVIKPDLIEAQKGLIMLALDSKNYSEAVRIAKSIQKQNPKDPMGYQFEGDVAISQKKWDAAADAYRNGLKVVPAPGLLIKLHGVLLAGGKTVEASKLTATWLKENPKDVGVRLYLGDEALSRKDFESAEKFYLGALQLQAGNAVVLNNLAWVSGKLNKDGAIAYAEKALALMPKEPAFMDTLATLYSDKNDYAKALEWQTKAMALAPQSPNYKLGLAKIHIKGGKKDLARQQLDELAKLGDKFPGQAEVAALIKGL